MPLEGLQHCAQVARIQQRVVINEANDLTRGIANSSIASVRKALLGLEDVAESRKAMAGGLRDAARIVGGIIVHQQNFGRAEVIVNLRQASQRLAEQNGTVISADADRQLHLVPTDAAADAPPATSLIMRA